MSSSFSYAKGYLKKKNLHLGGGSCRILECASTFQKMALKAVFGHFWPLVTPPKLKKTYFLVKIKIFIGFLSQIIPYDNLIIDKYSTPPYNLQCAM